MLSTETTTHTPPSRSTVELGGLEPSDERALLERLIADDERAWREFNVRYSRLIYRCITRVTSRFNAVVAAEDVREIYALLCMQWDR